MTEHWPEHVDPEPGAEARSGSMSDDRERLASLPVRLVQVFVSPGKLMDQLAREPRWLGAMLVSTVIVATSLAIIPVELMVEAQRAAMIERGQELPEMSERATQVMRAVVPIASGLATMLFSAVFAGVYMVIFAFFLGDEGRFVQYLAAVTHAWFIAALLGLLLTPLRISTGDPQYTLNLASFFFFLPDGYLYNVLRALDLTQIWSTLVIAQGAHAIDRRRSFKSAATIMLGILLMIALIVGSFM
ncbi:MAG: YIP1 family protein [Gemmatimonadota bacterium]|nr:YIP1 family protein [Gemmatimonadota bacterium]